jgi:hypothetical protein
MAAARKWLTKLRRAKQDKAYREENRERIKSRTQKYYLKNREHKLQYAQEYRKEHLEQVRAYDRQRNAVRRKTHAAYYRDKVIERRMGCRTPRWADKALLQFWHDLTKTPLFNGYHVDHIVPLRGKDVCGLNTPENIQILPAQQNLSKKNSFCNAKYQEWRRNGEDGPFLPY